MSCAEEAKVSIPRGAGGGPREGCARSSKGAGDGEFPLKFPPLYPRSSFPRDDSFRPSYLARISHPIPSLLAMQRDDINPFLWKVLLARE